MRSIAKRFPGASFFLAGVVLSAMCMGLQLYWREIAGFVGVVAGYDTRPRWLVIVMSVITALPWIAGASAIVLRVLKGKQIKWIAFCLGEIVPVAALIALILFGTSVMNLIERQDFDSSAWIAQDSKDVEWPTRLTMIDDLMERKVLDGMTQQEVLALLGPGTSSDYWRDWDLHYWLGPERGPIRIDSEWLVIKFDAQGKVAQYQIVRD